MSRGTKQFSQNGNSSSTINGTQQQSPQNNSRRGIFLGDFIMDRGDAVDCGNKQGNKSQHMVAQRKASLQDATSKSSVNGITEGQRKARSKQRFIGNQSVRDYQRANSSSLSDDKSTLSTKQNNVLNGKDQNQNVDAKKINAKLPNGKENYWYYDRLSNGYYYEHNGTRGWRKNNAKMEAALRNMEDSQKWEQQIIQSKNQKKISLNDCTNNSKILNPLPSLLFAQQLSKLIPHSNGQSTTLNNSPMAIKSYDNDGYFYEMGSVDGWRRRQPGCATPSGATSPFQTKKGGNAISTTTNQVYDQQTPRRKPLQYQAYQQPAPHCGFNLQDVASVMINQQQNNPHNHHNNSINNCCGGTSPAVACCCLTATAAALAAQLVLKQQEILANKKENNKMKHSSEIYSLIDNLTTKGLDFGELNTNAALDRLTSSDMSQPLDLGTNWQMPEEYSNWGNLSNEKEKFNDNNNNTFLTTTTTIPTNKIIKGNNTTTNNDVGSGGSFEDPIDIIKYQSLQSYTGVDCRILNDFSVFL